MYRDDVGTEDERATKLRADIEALEQKLVRARADAERLTLEERGSLRRKLRPLLRWWGIGLLLTAFCLGMIISFAGRGLDKPQRDPCDYLKGTPITVPAR